MFSRLSRTSAASLTALVLSTSVAFAAPPAMQSLGTFSSVVHTTGGEDEHASGCTVSLWRNADKLVGTFTSQYGLADMKPTGVLEHVEFDKATGTLKFDCKMSTGSTIFKGKEVSTRELFKFSGLLKPPLLTGKLTDIDMLDARHKPEVHDLKLRRTTGVDASQIKTTSYSEWQKAVSEELKNSGPKW